MELTSLRYWQWMIIGVLAGTAVGYAWVGAPVEFPRTGDTGWFKGAIRVKALSDKRGIVPRIRNITVHNPETDPSNVLVYPVTFEMLDSRDIKNPLYVERGIYARTPFDGKENVREFLQNRSVPFTDRSGRAQYFPVAYGATAGLVGIGLIWPAAIRLMTGVGLAPPPKPKEAKPQHRTGEDVDEMLVKDRDRSVKATDVAALDKLNSDMESKLATGLPAGGASRAPAPAAEEPVSVLMSGTGSRSASDPTATPIAAQPEEKKDYKGEYYPVVRTTKRDDA